MGVKGIHLPIDYKFWRHVDKKNNDECWNWTGSKDKKGYGLFSLGHTTIHTNRMSWILTNGEIPEGLLVCHKCDNPSCVNPNHLFLGANKDNNQDKINKGRAVFPKQKTGKENSNGKLSSEDVKEIRDLYSTGKYTYTQLARKFSVSFQHIGSIVTQKSRVIYG